MSHAEYYMLLAVIIATPYVGKYAGIAFSILFLLLAVGSLK